ncbi:hypothetical protein PRIPAC_88658 [Pristionchus pacificus]|uniref:Uncharacterized protein n=1 Tax=Pristionchus pacificus TaxID=54126 RepID=A0A2A6B7M2_PRIPA|nr:hypothetical protein PRIPAC_88658 [Pristionchus pacificus]|eukprot:PDM61853.1 hypothetical protein PRIPAC_51295 [Pristionchus pacificus]
MDDTIVRRAGTKCAFFQEIRYPGAYSDGCEKILGRQSAVGQTEKGVASSVSGASWVARASWRGRVLVEQVRHVAEHRGRLITDLHTRILRIFSTHQREVRDRALQWVLISTNKQQQQATDHGGGGAVHALDVQKERGEGAGSPTSAAAAAFQPPIALSSASHVPMPATSAVPGYGGLTSPPLPALDRRFLFFTGSYVGTASRELQAFARSGISASGLSAPPPVIGALEYQSNCMLASFAPGV